MRFGGYRRLDYSFTARYMEWRCNAKGSSSAGGRELERTVITCLELGGSSSGIWDTRAAFANSVRAAIAEKGRGCQYFFLTETQLDQGRQRGASRARTNIPERERRAGLLSV